MRPTARVLAWFFAAAAHPALASAQVAPSDLIGSWAAESYLMAGGDVHDVRGRIFFSERDWQVLFFVADEDGELRRASGEGGTWALEAGALVFRHLYNFSQGAAMPGLPAADLRMVARGPEEAPLEPTEVRIEGDVLTLHFPSGNRMAFRRR